MRLSSVPSFLLSSLVLLMLVPLAQAQQAHRSVEVSPLIMELEIENSKTYLREILIKNKNSVAYEITFEAFDVEIDPDTHNVKFLPAESRQNQNKSLASWIVPESKTVFVILPDEEFSFQYRLSSFPGAEPGDYYGSLNFYYRPVAQLQNGNVKVRQSLGSLLLVSLNGETGNELASPYTISRLTLNRRSQETETLLNFSNNTLRLVNLKPLLTLRDSSGEVYYQKEGYSKRIFPGETTFVSHSFPNIYLASEVPLTLQYSLWDKQGVKKFYEEEIELESLKGVSSGNIFPRLRIFFLVSGALLLVLVLYFKRKPPVVKRRSLRKRKPVKLKRERL